MATQPLTEVKLSKPIKRGEQEIASVKVRSPGTGEMRGLSMFDVVKLDVDALIELLPRITMPPLLKEEVETLPLSDFFALSTEVANFLLPPEARPDSHAA